MPIILLLPRESRAGQSYQNAFLTDKYRGLLDVVGRKCPIQVEFQKTMGQHLVIRISLSAYVSICKVDRALKRLAGIAPDSNGDNLKYITATLVVEDNHRQTTIDFLPVHRF